MIFYKELSPQIGILQAHLTEEQLLLSLPLPSLQLLLWLRFLLIALDGFLLHLHHVGQPWGFLLARDSVAVRLLQKGLVFP